LVAGLADAPTVFGVMVLGSSIEAMAMIGGFFGFVNNRFSIANSVVAESTFKGYYAIGGLVGMSSHWVGISRIENVFVFASLQSEQFFNTDTGEYVDRGLGEAMGGLIGVIDGYGLKLEIYQVAALTEIYGAIELGGFIGKTTSSPEISMITIRDSYAVTSIHGNYRLGGAIGNFESGNVFMHNSFFVSDFVTPNNLGMTIPFEQSETGGVFGDVEGFVDLKNVYYYLPFNPMNLLFGTGGIGSLGAIGIQHRDKFYTGDTFIMNPFWDMNNAWSTEGVDAYPIPTVILDTLFFVMDLFEFFL
jgi:hypothetical protein